MKKIINNSVISTIKNDSDAEELIKLIKNKEEEIISIDFNSTKINEIMVKISDSLLDNLEKLESESFNNTKKVYYVPFGIVTGMPTMNWIGPWIPIKTTNVGMLETNIKTDLKPYGINNVLLKIDIVVSVSTKVLLPYVTENFNTYLEIPVVMKVIQGKIPQVYGGLYASNSNTLEVPVE